MRQEQQPHVPPFRCFAATGTRIDCVATCRLLAQGGLLRRCNEPVRLLSIYGPNQNLDCAADRDLKLALERGQVEVKELKVVGTEKLALGMQALRCLIIRR
jgi:hypothetical protein